MNKFTKNKIAQKIIITLISLIMLNFIYPYIPSYADTSSDNIDEAPGGVLLEPLLGLISSVGEGVIWVIQSQLLGMDTSNVYVTDSFNSWGNVLKWVGIIPDAMNPFSSFLGLSKTGSWLEENFPDNFFLPIYKISPQEIFSDQIPILHINFLNPKDYSIENNGQSGALPVLNSAKVLGPQIAKWYVAIRNFVLVGLMVVLLYIGIRIVISSTAGEKAKYKEHIKDWLVAVLLVVFMHYIMAFALTITEYITNILNNQNEAIAFPLPDNVAGDIANALGTDADKYKASDGKYYYSTNLMGYARLQQQMLSRDSNGNVVFSWNYIGYTIIYLVLVIYTVMFLIIYLKRVIYMAFLTMIAPLVALTYPIDKLSDGQAQAFNMWLKEYVYNLLLQPFHLLLYTLLVGSVLDLATSNMLYAIVALGFLMPAENLLRRFFGFEKAATTGSIVGGVVGGSLAMNAISNLGKIGSISKKSGGKSSGGSGNGDSDNTNNTKIRTADKNLGGNDELFAAGFGGKSSQPSEDQVEQGKDQQESPTIRLSGTNQTGDAQGEEALDSADKKPKYEQGELDLDFPDEKPKYEQGELDLDFPDENSDQQANTSSKIRTVDLPNDVKSKEVSNVETPPRIVANNQTQSKVEDKKKIKRPSKLKAVGGTALKYTGKGVKEVAKRAPRLIAKAGLGAALGVAGVAAGVASGDWSNIAAYGATAAAVGSQLGDAATNIASNAATGSVGMAKGIRDEYRSRVYSSDEIKAKQNEKIDKEWRKDKEVIKLYQEKFGNDYEKAMDNAMEYRKYGITDDKAIIAAQNLKGLSDDSKTSKERIALAKAATMVKSDKDMKNYSERLKDNGISDEKIKEVRKNIRIINKM